MIQLLLAWFLLLPVAQAQGNLLEQVRVFVGEDHARVLVIARDAVEGTGARTAPPVGSAPARAVVTLGGTVLSEDLQADWFSDDARWWMPVDWGGLQRVAVASLGEDLQVAVEMNEARTLQVTPIGERALLMDLRVPDAPPDASLPDPQVLAAWISGVSLDRQAEAIADPRIRIVIDPGHGGWDPGAVGVTGTRESDITLALSTRVARELERRLGAEVVLTRSDDTFIPLRDRAALANALDADLFLSIHANAAPGPTAWGIETYYLDFASDSRAAAVAARENAVAIDEGPIDDIVSDLVAAGNKQLSQALAAEIQAAVIANLRGVYGAEQIRDLGVKTAQFYVLVYTRMPAILYEASFLSNSEDEMRLRQPLYQQMTAQAIAEAVENYLARQE